MFAYCRANRSRSIALNFEENSSRSVFSLAISYSEYLDSLWWLSYICTLIVSLTGILFCDYGSVMTN